VPTTTVPTRQLNLESVHVSAYSYADTSILTAPMRRKMCSPDAYEQKNRIAEAEAAGVKSVPALVIGGDPFHINFGAALADLR